MVRKILLAGGASILTVSSPLVEAQPSLRFHGAAVREEATPAGSLKLTIQREGSGEANQAILPMELGANESKVEGPWPEGVECPNGIFVNILAGSARVVVYYSLDEHLNGATP